ncbi:hypothetical protein [Streptomyces acidiscabies]|uniref:hypothetical protein n=1 Tax=Streptomyces acidiscabies TaxID=42234 RepID=UPI002D21B162|nr:hypothetical protein [Streptomyces acidiscabies]
MGKRGLQEADHVISRYRLTARQPLYQRGRKLSLLLLGAVKVHAPLNHGRRETTDHFLADVFRDVPLDLGSSQGGPVVQPFVRKLVQDDVLGLISARTATIENERELRRFNPEATCRAQPPVWVI